MRRAAHQIGDQPTVFTDPLALRILGAAGAAVLIVTYGISFGPRVGSPSMP
jgi:hypothetical protein